MEIPVENTINRYKINQTTDFFRKSFTGVTGIENNEPEYLEDLRIVSNRPYISQFFGTLVAFQIFMYYKERAGSQYVVKEFEHEEFV